MAKYTVQKGETLWEIARRTLPNMEGKQAVLAIFDKNWDALARRFWLPADVELEMPAEFDPSANPPFDPSANPPAKS